MKADVILTEIPGDEVHQTLVVGWDICGACHLHVRTCQCPSGPKEPEYVRNWRPTTDVDNPKTQNAVSSSSEVAISGEIESGKSKKSGAVCRSCNKAVTAENADREDSGAWHCWDCQEKGQ